jgi:hypothetical protein
MDVWQGVARDSQPFQRCPARRARCLWLSSTPSDTPRRTPMSDHPPVHDISLQRIKEYQATLTLLRLPKVPDLQQLFCFSRIIKKNILLVQASGQVRKGRHSLFDRNFPCQTLKIRNVSLVVMGS